MQQIQLSVPTLFGLEGVAAEEMRRLGQTEVKTDSGKGHSEENFMLEVCKVR